MRLILLTAFCFLSLGLFSQSLQLSQNYIDHQYSNGDVILTNISDEPVQVSMIIEARCLSDQDEIWFQACLQVCQDWTDDIYIQYVNPPVTINPGASNEYLSFHVEDYADGVLEPMIWRQYFYVLGTPSDNAWIEISLGDVTCPESNMIVGVEEEQPVAISAYPNPTSGLVKITNTTGQPCTYQLRDLRGQLVFESTSLRDGENALNLGSIPQGLYIGRLVDDSGNVHATERVVVE